MSKEIKCYGIDDGHFSIKIVNGVQKYFPSRVLSGNLPYLSINDDENKSFVYEVDGNIYTVVEEPAINSGLHFLDTRTDDFPFSDINLILVYHSLVRAGVDGDCKICTGLPFNQYYVNHARNQTLIDKKLASFKRKVNPVNSSNIPNIIEHRVMAEGVGGYMDLRFDEDGSISLELDQLAQDGLVSIVDIGGRTTDIVTFDNNNIAFNRSTTLDIGGLTIKENLLQFLRAELKTNTLPDKIIDDLLINNGIFEHRQKDKSINVQVQLAEMKKQVAASIINQIKRNIGVDGRDSATVVFIGGGSMLLKEQIIHLYPKTMTKFVKDPLYSNARGFCKALKNKGN